MSDSDTVLDGGESWLTDSIHQKGLDSFTTTAYYEGVGPLREALRPGCEVDLHAEFTSPRSTSPNARGVGAGRIIPQRHRRNTLLLHPDTFERSEVKADRLMAIRDYVAAGGGLVMSGYLTFQGIEGKARYAGSPVEEALPVTLQQGDDRWRSFRCAAVRPSRRPPHRRRVARGLACPPRLQPSLCRMEADLVVSVGGDPLVVAGEFGRGRSAVFTSDCGRTGAATVAWLGSIRFHVGQPHSLGRPRLTADVDVLRQVGRACITRGNPGIDPVLT